MGASRAGAVPRWIVHVNLRGYGPGHPATAAEVLDAFLRALGMQPERIPVEVDAKAALYRSLLAGRRVLVVLDNANSADQVRPVAAGQPWLSRADHQSLQPVREFLFHRVYWDDLLTICDIALEAARRSGDRAAEARNHVMRSERHTCVANWEEALGHLERAAAHWRAPLAIFEQYGNHHVADLRERIQGA